MARFVLPVKRLRQAKTRLRLPPKWRAAFAEAMFLDTLDCVLAADLGPVVVVSPDEAVLDRARDAGAAPMLHRAPLNESVAAAAGTDAAAAVMPDLPAMRIHELRSLLAAHQHGAVRDHTGLGTTVLLGPALCPGFGPDSFARHVAAGYPPIHLSDSGLTVDVDTLEDLAVAVSLGVGPRTRAAYEDLRADPAAWAGRQAAMPPEPRRG